MAIFPTKIHDEYNASNHMEFVMDQDSDVSLLPSLDTCAPGSKATSIASGTVFYLTTFGFWTKSTKALMTEELNVSEPGTYIAEEGKAFNPVIVTGGGDNPNYIETIEGTLVNPFGSYTISEILQALANNSISVRLDLYQGEALTLYSAGTYDGDLIFSGARYDGLSLINAMRLVYSAANPAQPLAVATATADNETIDVRPYATAFRSVLTIIHHPMPDSGT